jgi:hypothetical protein
VPASPATHLHRTEVRYCPEPERLTVRVPALLVMVNVPVVSPVIFGVNATEMLQVVKGATGLPQWFVATNSGLLLETPVITRSSPRYS